MPDLKEVIERLEGAEVMRAFREREAAAHAILTTWRRVGEWFQADLETVVAAVLKAAAAPAETLAALRQAPRQSPPHFNALGDIDPVDVRRGLNLTQAAFAARFGLPLGLVRDLEQGRSEMSMHRRVLYRVIQRDPDAVDRALSAA